jgi:uncharacterized membrane protein
MLRVVYLRGYESACPGAATRIIAMAEKAQERQENRLDKAMEYEYGDRRLGLILAFCALIALLGSGLIALGLGYDKVGGGLLAAGILSTIIGTFVHGRRSSVHDEDEDEDEGEEEQAPPPANAAGGDRPQITGPTLTYWQRLWAAIRGR